MHHAWATTSTWSLVCEEFLRGLVTVVDCEPDPKIWDLWTVKPYGCSLLQQVQCYPANSSSQSKVHFCLLQRDKTKQNGLVQMLNFNRRTIKWWNRTSRGPLVWIGTVLYSWLGEGGPGCGRLHRGHGRRCTSCRHRGNGAGKEGPSSSSCYLHSYISRPILL